MSSSGTQKHFTRYFSMAATTGGAALLSAPLAFLLLLLLCCGAVVRGAVVGFNYGGAAQMAAAPAASRVVELLKTQHVTSIRLYEPEGAMLAALGGTGITVAVGVPNSQLLSVGQNNATAANWVKNNVAAYLPNTNITTIVVGDAVFTSLPNAALVLLPAMRYLYSALVASNLQNQIKITTTLSTSLILDSFPPSQAFFNKSLLLPNLLPPILSFLAQTSSFAMLDVFPYDVYKSAGGVIRLDYALMQPGSPAVVDSNTLLSYANLFDAILDSAFYALAKLNFSALPLSVSAVGWPYSGGPSDPDATPDNAAAFYSNLIRHVVNNSGTPKRPRFPIDTFLLELFDEDLKQGPATVKHYGLFNATTSLPNYLLRLTGSGQLLANDTTDRLYCVAKPGVDDDTLQAALDWVCGIGRANCSAIQPGMLCYVPDTVANHASYAFDYYYQSSGRSDDSCSFNGVAVITTTNPSYGACLYPGSLTNVTATPKGNVTLSSLAPINGNSSAGGNDTTSASGGSAAVGGAPMGFVGMVMVLATTLLVPMLLPGRSP